MAERSLLARLEDREPGPCRVCAALPDSLRCEVCRGTAYLTHGEPTRTRAGGHRYACQGCRAAGLSPLLAYPDAGAGPASPADVAAALDALR